MKRRDFSKVFATAAALAGAARLSAAEKPEADLKIGLYSITYLGVWYRGDALTLEQVIDRAKNACVLIDEAYHPIHAETSLDLIAPQAAGRGNVVLLRTFSKAFGLAGCRIGVIASSKENVERCWPRMCRKCGSAVKAEALLSTASRNMVCWPSLAWLYRTAKKSRAKSARWQPKKLTRLNKTRYPDLF